jgi:Flp pilus assembly CpaF family ATPase
MAEPQLADLSVWPGATRVRLVGRRWVDVDPLVSDGDECLGLIRHLLRDAGHLGDPSQGSHELAVGTARVTVYLDWAPFPAVVVRSHRSRPERLSDLVAWGMLPAELADELARAVRAGLAVLVSGATGVGKTTFAAALCREIPDDEQIVTIEDTYELGLHAERPTSVLPFLARPANVEGAGERTMALLTRGALRASPDRVVVGEVRGPEALYMIRAMETGARGSVGTVHADSAAAGLEKLCDYILEGGGGRSDDYVARMVARHIHLVVHLEVDRGRHHVAEVYEVTGAEDGRIHGGALWRSDSEGACTRTGVAVSPLLARKLAGR